MVRCIGSSGVVVSWIHPSSMRCCCLPLGWLTRHLNWIRLGLSLLVVKGLALSVRLSVRVGWVERDTLSILVRCAHHSFVADWRMWIRNNSCDSINVIKASVCIWGCGVRTSRIVRSGQRLSPHNATHDGSLLLIRYILPLWGLPSVLSWWASFWRMKRSIILDISTSNHNVALPHSATVDHLSLLLVKNLLSQSCGNVPSRCCRTCP